MYWSYIIVQALSRERLQGFKLRPSLPPRQGLTPPLPPWRGLWPSRIGTAWASALPSLPAADTRVTSWAERRSAGDTGEGDSEGEGNTWPGANLLCTLFLSHSVNHSVTTSHTPPPSLLRLLVHLLYANSLTQFFTLFLHAPVFRHVSLLPSEQLSNSSPQQTRCAQFNKVNYMTITILFILALWDVNNKNIYCHNVTFPNC